MTLPQPLCRLLLPAVLAAGLCLTAFVAAQQALRLAANDPQVQIVEDAAAALAMGVEPRTLMPGLETEIERSLSPFISIYDAGGVPIASSARLDGQLPKLPAGVLADVVASGQQRLTWQPEPDIRIALVVDRYRGQQDGFVAVGRSLRETDARTGWLGFVTILGWLGTIGAVAATDFALARRSKGRAKKSLKAL